MGGGHEPPDERLVLLAKDGNLDAFNSLVDRYQGAVYSLSYRLLGSREGAEDASQEAFISAYRAIGRFDGGNFRSWLLRITANQCKDELRRRKRKDAATSLDAALDSEEAPIEIRDPGEGILALVERRELGEALEGLLLELPFEQRQAVLLVDVYDFAYEEVSELTNTSLGTIKSRIHRGRERLRILYTNRRELFPGPGR